MENFGAHDRLMVGGREYEYIVVDIIMFMTTTLNLHFFVYWGACRPPPAFASTVGGLEYEDIAVDIIKYTSVTIYVPFFVYWGACRPPDPPAFFRHGRRARIQVYSCRYNYVYEYRDKTAFFRILGGVPAPRPPAFFSARLAGGTTFIYL